MGVAGRVEKNMDEAAPNPSRRDRNRTQTVPLIVLAGSVLAVLAMNLVILGYAVRSGLPLVETGADDPTVIATSDVAKPRRVPTGAAAASRDEGDLDVVEDWFDDDDWDAEELPVVNPIDLPDPAAMRTSFLRQCAICHGAEGRGDGPMAALLLPRPRDFVGSPFRYASPGADQEHVISGLERTIAHGVPRSAMPGFEGVLTEAQTAGLARYVLSLRDRSDEPPGQGVADVGVRPPLTPELVARGKELYTTLSCNTCHGDTGRGDGINSRSLVDSQEKPVRPADLTSGLFKSGQAPEDLCRTILKGIPGTPMVAYESILAVENVDEETLNVMDAWALVAYIRSFSPSPPHIGASSGAALVVQPAPDEAMVSDPSHVAWLGISPTEITIKPPSVRDEHTTSLEVRVVRTRDSIAFCLDWKDDTMDLSRGSELSPDAAAVMFGLGDEVPPLPMCVELTGFPADESAYLWHWKADRQFDATAGRWHREITLDESRPRGWYLFMPGPEAKLPLLLGGSQPTAQFAADPGDPRTLDHAVIEANVRALGSIRPQPPDRQDALASAAWSNGFWRLVIVRPMATDDEQDVQFASRARIPVSFAIWNGAKGDRGGSKLVSGWHWLVSGG